MCVCRPARTKVLTASSWVLSVCVQTGVRVGSFMGFYSPRECMRVVHTQPCVVWVGVCAHTGQTSTSECKPCDSIPDEMG